MVTVRPRADVSIPSDVTVRMIVCDDGGGVYYQQLVNHQSFSTQNQLPVSWPESDPTAKFGAPDRLYLFARGDIAGQNRFISGAIICSRKDFEAAKPLEIVLVPVRE
jgi:hypothetical protein